MTRLREGMMQDMQMRNFFPGTIKGQVLQVAQFAKQFNKLPDLLRVEEILPRQLAALPDRKLSSWSLNLAMWAFGSFYKVTLGREWAVEHPRYPSQPNPARRQDPKCRAAAKAEGAGIWVHRFSADERVFDSACGGQPQMWRRGPDCVSYSASPSTK